MALFHWLRRRREMHADVDEEIRSHLAMATRERIVEGVDPKTARYAALKEFGNVTLRIEEGRRVWSSRWIDATGDLWKDARHAAQVLAKNPAFSLIVIAVLAVGIGMNTMVFTLFKSLALRPLAGVEGSGRLGVVLAKTSGGRLQGLSYPDYQYIRDRDGAFAGLSGSCPTPLSLGLGRRGERVWGELVSGNYFQLFGVRAKLGRTLLPSDEVAPGMHPVVVLSDGLWRRAFGGDPNIAGKMVHLNGYPMTVVGVADASFHGSVVSFDGEVYVPIMMAPQLGIAFRTRPAELLHDRKTPLMIAYGRLRPGVTLAVASVQTAVLSEQRAKDAPVQDFQPADDRAADLAVPVGRANLHAARGDCRWCHGGAAAFDRLRECRWLGARARYCPPRRNCRSPRSGRQPRQDPPLAAHREPGAGRAGRGSRSCAGVVRVAFDGVELGCERSSTHVFRHVHGLDGDRFCSVGGFCQRTGVRARPGATRFTG
jgi:hypothetical protein